ncbi:hypothetical protein [Chryseobacterium sp. YR221]|uniref:hypothetical protein n=1 Tax=Chryseobacterium sp. YR221 TaxID=1500293 RepID=UPI0015C4ADCC|nr:hypothetical protein [Chryseobacterium sp. YR221]
MNIRKTDKEIIDEINKGNNLPPSSSENYVSDVPEQFKSYMEQNRDKMDGWKTKPSFMVDNKRFI